MFKDSLDKRVDKNRVVSVGEVTLTAGATTTTTTNLAMSAQNHVFLSPLSANAAGALATTYVSARAFRSFTVTHANAVSTDRKFSYIIVAGDIIA